MGFGTKVGIGEVLLLFSNSETRKMKGGRHKTWREQ
jgi:hypothetical protein